MCVHHYSAQAAGESVTSSSERQDVLAVDVHEPIGLVDGVEIALTEVRGDGHGGELSGCRAAPANVSRR